ncbi:helix-turn-helix transcriptional regulator [Streptomyces polygonati]|uniref:Helix-turn-helix transcriptional regulator n=1 Tax=Streptomyces polygonati TaxID=1617087 RepID=A0ABV8HL34_9ACTN
MTATPQTTGPTYGDDTARWGNTLELGPVRMSVTRVAGRPSPVLGRPVGGDRRDVCRMALACDNPLTLGHGAHATALRPGDLMLCGSPEESDAAPGAGERPARVIVWELPRPLLAVPDDALLGLAGRSVPTRGGPGALLARFVEGLAEQAEELAVRSAGWLGAAVVDLTGAFISGAADAGPVRPPQSHQAALLHKVKTYIDGHLGDPDLSPRAIAAAHHISLRYLHHLFQQDKRTVGGYVRERRLEHCRAELSDPRFATSTVGEIRSRWGFGDAAVFCRTFKKAYGISPAEHRGRPAAGGTGRYAGR